jgi:hypothetical protein
MSRITAIRSRKDDDRSRIPRRKSSKGAQRSRFAPGQGLPSWCRSRIVTVSRPRGRDSRPLSRRGRRTNRRQQLPDRQPSRTVESKTSSARGRPRLAWCRWRSVGGRSGSDRGGPRLARAGRGASAPGASLKAIRLLGDVHRRAIFAPWNDEDEPQIGMGGCGKLSLWRRTKPRRPISSSGTRSSPRRSASTPSRSASSPP